MLTWVHPHRAGAVAQVVPHQAEPVAGVPFQILCVGFRHQVRRLEAPEQRRIQVCHLRLCVCRVVAAGKFSFLYRR